MPDPHLPPEILNHTVNLLHGTEDALKNCCLVSKSWIPRARKHLFADIKFCFETDLQSWKETFPDPSTSPAHYAKTLFVGCCHIITAADAEPGGWITGFTCVVNLELANHAMLFRESSISFAPFHGISSVIKSLRVDCVLLSSSQILDLVLSFPLLQDLAVLSIAEVVTQNDGGSDGLSTVVQPSSSSIFTGSLELSLGRGMKSIVRRLLSLPGGLHLRKLTLTWCHEEDPSLTMELVEECSHTLNSLDITRATVYFGSGRTPVDLSKAKKLKNVVFRLKLWSIDWITTILRTITLEHRDIRQISIHVPHYLTLCGTGADVKETVGETACEQLLDLDRLMAQLWESHSIRPRVVCTMLKGGERSLCVGDCIGCLFPEITGRKIIDPIEYEY